MGQYAALRATCHPINFLCRNWHLMKLNLLPCKYSFFFPSLLRLDINQRISRKPILESNTLNTRFVFLTAENVELGYMPAIYLYRINSVFYLPSLSLPHPPPMLLLLLERKSVPILPRSLNWDCGILFYSWLL